MKKLVTAVSLSTLLLTNANADSDVYLSKQTNNDLGYTQQNHILNNSSSNTAKVVTIKYTNTNGSGAPSIYTKSYTIEPGARKNVGEHYSSTPHSTNDSIHATIEGTRDLN